MADSGDQSEEKTEQATDHKLKKSREKGDIASSKDAVGLAGFVCAVLYLGFMMPDLLERLIEPLIMIADQIGQPGGADLAHAAKSVAIGVVMALLPIIILVIFSAFLMTIIVNKGFVFSAEKMKPEFKKLNPAKNAKEKFKRRNVTEFAKTVLNMLVIMAIFGVTLYLMSDQILLAGICGLDCGMDVVVTIIKIAVIPTLLYLILVAGLDVRIQQALFMHDQRMTKTELKREHKEQDGDPFIKNARRGISQQIGSQSMVSALNSTVIILTDPRKGIAVGVWHPGGKDITARGVVTMACRGKMARAFLAVAEEKGIASTPSSDLAEKFAGFLPMQQIVSEEANAALYNKLRAYGYTG